MLPMKASQGQISPSDLIRGLLMGLPIVKTTTATDEADPGHHQDKAVNTAMVALSIKTPLQVQQEIPGAAGNLHRRTQS